MKPNIEELEDNDNIFFHNIIDYYQSRPDSLKDVSLASFAADYEYYKTMIHDNNEEDDNILDSCIVLRNNMGYLKIRRRHAIIWYYIGKYEDDEQKIRSIMLLFHLFQNEVTEVHNNPNIVDKYNKLKETVDAEQRKLEPNPDFMEFLENIDIKDIKDIDKEEQ